MTRWKPAEGWKLMTDWRNFKWFSMSSRMHSKTQMLHKSESHGKQLLRVLAMLRMCSWQRARKWFLITWIQRQYGEQGEQGVYTVHVFFLSPCLSASGSLKTCFCHWHGRRQKAKSFAGSLLGEALRSNMEQPYTKQSNISGNIRKQVYILIKVHGSMYITLLRSNVSLNKC